MQHKADKSELSAGQAQRNWLKLAGIAAALFLPGIIVFICTSRRIIDPQTEVMNIIMLNVVRTATCRVFPLLSSFCRIFSTAGAVLSAGCIILSFAIYLHLQKQGLRFLLAGILMVCGGLLMALLRWAFPDGSFSMAPA